MEMLSQAISFFLHLDHHISYLITNYGTGVYLIVFLIIFCETGLVVTPFLPGDSLLFVLGALSATGDLNLTAVLLLLYVAAIAGDSVNYSIGTLLSQKVLTNQKIPFIKQSYIQRTHEFYEKYGNKAIVICRFVPILRTFVPFMAGVGNMPYRKFIFYNIFGGVLWVSTCVLSGFFFGNLPFVKDNFSLVVLAIIVISIIPAVVEFFKHKSSKS